MALFKFCWHLVGESDQYRYVEAKDLDDAINRWWKAMISGSHPGYQLEWWKDRLDSIQLIDRAPVIQ